MKLYTSYFYQIRFFTPNMIPLSTAWIDPKWFYAFQKQGYVHKDKNGVYNGLRAEPLHPDETCDGLCHGPEGCDQEPSYCRFLQRYRRQLDKLDCAEIVARAERLARKIQDKEGFTEEPVIVFIFHEAPNNPCSERWVVQQWFHANGYTISEWRQCEG